jgi:CcmD family protein
MTLRRFALVLLLLFSLDLGAHAYQPPSPPPPQDEFVPITELPPQDQLPSAPLLIAAYAFVWLALGGYVLSVARRLTTVQQEIERLESDVKKGSRA